MKNPFKLFLLLAGIIVMLSACKKDKLSGDNLPLIGTWTSITTSREPGNCGIVAATSYNPDFKLTLFEKGKYTLYTGNKKTETGRLLIKAGIVTFECTERKSEFDGRKILKFNTNTLYIDRNGCNDDYVYTFTKN